MFEQSAGWKDYYRELDPRRRRAAFDGLCAGEPDDGANEYRRLLFEARHLDPKSPDRTLDRMLFQCVNFLQLCRSAWLFKGGAIKEVRRAMKELRFDLAGQYGEAGTGALYWEIRNAAARYLSTCESPSYNRRLFGLAPSRPEARDDRVVRDIWQMAEGLALRTGLETEMALWDQAVLDAYGMTGEDAAARFSAYCGKMAKN